MTSGIPAITGDVLTATTFNSLVQFTIGTEQTADYTAVLADSYQVLVPMNKATAVAFKIPTNSVAIPVGSVITVLNRGAGLVTISALTPGTTTVASAGATSAAPTVAQWKSAVCVKMAAESWVVLGGIA